MKHSNERRALAIFLLLLLTTTTAIGQSYQPAVEYHSLMNLRFYEASGGFLVEGLQYVFWPAGLKKATFVIARPNGEIVKTVSLPVEPVVNFPAFGMSFYAAGTAAVGEPGRFSHVSHHRRPSYYYSALQPEAINQHGSLQSTNNVCAGRTMA